MLRGVLAIVRKDLRIEWRTKESLASFAVLGVLLVVIFSVALDPAPADAPRLAPSVLWATFVFTGLLGIQRGFVLERENDCLGGLLASPLDPAALYLGKLTTNVLLLGVMQAIVLPLVAVLLHVQMGETLPALVLVLLLGNLGFAALATLFAAMTVRARAREVMLPVLLLPLLVPVLIGGVKASEAALHGGLHGAAGPIGVLGAFDAIFLVAGVLLFEQVIRD